MAGYFAVGNMWLIIAGVVYWGRVSNTGGDLNAWKLFGVGRNFETYQYSWCLGLPIAMVVVCLAMHLLSSRTSVCGPGVQAPRENG
jgi:hypothetical protein